MRTPKAPHLISALLLSLGLPSFAADRSQAPPPAVLTPPAIITTAEEKAQAGVYALSIRLAALSAAIADQPDITLPPQLAAAAGHPLVAELLRHEAELLAADRARLTRRLDMISLQQDELDREVEALEKQLAALRDYGATMAEGRDRSGAAAILSGLEVEMYKAKAQLSRARQQRFALDAQLDAALDTWRREKMETRISLTPQLAAAKAELAATRAGDVPSPTALGQTGSKSFTLAPGKVRMVLETRLEPGDTIQVGGSKITANAVFNGPSSPEARAASYRLGAMAPADHPAVIPAVEQETELFYEKP